MAKSINDNPTYRSNKSYTDFGMHQHLEFTSTVGQLLPVYYDILNPGDKIRANAFIKTRTKPLASAAFAKIEEHVEWYFVPIHQVLRAFGSWFYGIQDLDTSLWNTVKSRAGETYAYNISSKLPYIVDKFFWAMMDEVRQSPGDASMTLMGENFFGQFVRLAEHLGIPSELLMDKMAAHDQTISDVQFSIVPYLFAAYQKIFMDFYRLGDRIANDPVAYSLDVFQESDKSNIFESFSDVYNSSAILKLFEMRYRPIAKDFYTNVYPSPIFGENQTSALRFDSATGGNLDSTLLKVHQWLTNVQQVRTLKDPGSGGTVGGSDPTAVMMNKAVGVDIQAADFTMANMKTLFASEKLLEVTRRAGKHYDAQTLAHFGADVPDTIEGQAIRLGGSSQEIIIGDVISTSGTESTPLGEIGGKGYSAGNFKPVNFTAPCHGILMAIYSAVPAVDYYQQGIDKLNCLIEKSDWFVPEYDNLGMQPMFSYQCGATLGDEPGVHNAEVRGWQYRYAELKQKYNRIIGGMKFTQKHWTIGKESASAAGTSAAHYYHSPDALNSVMEYDYLNGYNEQGFPIYNSASELFERDPLDHEMFFDVTKVSKMSRYGLMEL